MNENNLTQYKLLTESFLANKGMRHMADTAFSVFQNPIWILDSSYRFLARAFDPNASLRDDDPEMDTDAILRYLQDDISSQEFLDRSGMEALKANGIPQMLSTQPDLYHFRHSVFGCKTIAAGIRIRNTLVAFLLIPEISVFLDETMEALVLTFRDLLTQELMKDRFFQNNRDEYMSYLLMDMLTSKYPDDNIIQKRFETVDFQLLPYMNIVVVRKRLENARTCSMDLIRSQLSPVLSGQITAVVEDSLVILFHFPEHKMLDETQLDLLKQVCANNDLIAGISSRFSSLSELTKHYRLATRAALVCQRYIEDHRIIFYDDVFDLALLEYCDRHNHLMDFVHSSILHLMEYDEKYGTNYLYTFWIYTECGCNTQEAAARLYIHKNTLVYRVNKIKELLGSDLTSGKDLFAFQLSMRILRMLGKLAK